MPRKVKPKKQPDNPSPKFEIVGKPHPPIIVLTEEQEKTLDQLAAIHCTHAEIAAVLGVSHDTLERRYADRIKAGKAKGRASLRRAQFKNATQNDNPTMQIWLGKVELGQSETIVEQTSGKGGNRAPQFFRIGGQLLEI